jgi:predicted RNA-binding Zn ribbon-like protein
MTPDIVLGLANLTVARRPDRGPTVHPDPLAGPDAAGEALGLERVDASQLSALRELHETITELVDGLLSGRSVARAAAQMTRLAAPSTATVSLAESETHPVRAQLHWSDPTPAATLARRAALELGEIEVARLKRCERPDCNLVFYDATRSGTRRWHAESPCGNRERQRRYRAASRGSAPAEQP